MQDSPAALQGALDQPGGFFQFSITHPCFDTPHRKNLHDETGYTYAIEVGDYFDRRERSKSGSSSLLPRRSAKDYRLSAPPFSCAP